MKLRILTFLTIALLTSAGLHAETFGAVLTGSQEAPNPVTTSGFGNATVTLDAAHTSMTVDLTVFGLSAPITVGHIHEAARGTAGGVRIDLAPATNMTNGRLNRTFTIPQAQGDAIAANPQNFYINMHTSTNPGGEIRGQLTPLDTTITWAGELRGSNEFPPVSSTAVGAFFITLDRSNLMTFDINTGTLVSPTAAHIHTGAVGASGGVRVGLGANAAAFTGNRLRGQVQVPEADATAFRANPAAFYVNVHTTANPGGEIRGQLAPAFEYDIPVAGKVTGANGENFVSDVRIFNPSYTSRAAVLVEYFARGTVANTNATSTIAVDIAPRGTAALDDIGSATQLNAVGTIGAVRVSSSSQLAVSSRIYDDRRARNGGTIGQFVPAVARANGLRRGVLPQLSNDSIARTNIGLFNPNIVPVDVRLELRNAAGTLLGSATLVLPALSQQQNSIGTYFAGVDLSNAPALALSFDASAPIAVYGSVIDGVSADQIFVSALPDPGVAAGQ
jgi:hypothetical protein